MFDLQDVLNNLFEYDHNDDGSVNINVIKMPIDPFIFVEDSECCTYSYTSINDTGQTPGQQPGDPPPPKKK